MSSKREAEYKFKLLRDNTDGELRVVPNNMVDDYLYKWEWDADENFAVNRKQVRTRWEVVAEGLPIKTLNALSKLGNEGSLYDHDAD